MIPNDYKTSLLIPSQLPEFIRDNPDYSNFVLFIQAYYEWLEQENNITDVTKNLLNYKDIDNLYSANTAANGTNSVVNQFVDYFQNDFLSYFPTNILADKSEVIKIAKQLYQSKGTPSSYKFLFRILYNSDVDIFFTNDAVLKPSSGKWYVPISLKLSSSDTNFLLTTNLRIFGQTTKSIATIQNAVLVKGKIEVFISDIERLFQSGEFITIVDSNNQPVYFLNGKIVTSNTLGAETLTAKIVGQISQVNINPNYRGQFYQSGNPVIVYGGLDSPTGHGAEAVVGTVTAGSIQSVSVTNGGYGYTVSPNTTINVSNATGAVITVPSYGINETGSNIANAVLIPTDYIGLHELITIGQANYGFAANPSAYANTSLANTFTFTTLTTGAIDFVNIVNGGGGITVQPTISATSTYLTENNLSRADLSSLGMLAPIQITNGGVGYQANDQIILTGGSGYGAHANVLTVNTTGSITSVGYVFSTYDSLPHHYPLGGMGFRQNQLPTCNVHSANTQAYGASLYVPGILGAGATFGVTTDRTGSITTINITDYGEDYIATPNVSLAVQDILVTGINGANVSSIPQNGDIVYQGTDASKSYVATVNSISIITSSSNPLQTIYSLRVFNYSSTPLLSLPLQIDGKNSFNISGSTGSITTYGDGTAQATATFLNGLSIGQGQYLDTTGQPSSYDVIQSSNYNAYTYELTLEKEIEKYREILLNLLHPSGMNIIGRFAMKSSNSANMIANNYLEQGHTLKYYTNSVSSNVTMNASFSNTSTNIIHFNNLNGVNLKSFISNTSVIQLTTSNNDILTVGVLSANSTSNTVTIKNNVWLAFANVAYVNAYPILLDDLLTDSGSDDLLSDLPFVEDLLIEGGTGQINISSLTNSYNLINGGIYTDYSYPLKDIVCAGDTVLVTNNTTRMVTGVDYLNNIVYINTPITSNVTLGLMSVNKTYTANAESVQIFGVES